MTLVGDDVTQAAIAEPATAEAAMALLERGEAAYGAGRLDEARGAFEALVAAGMLGGWAQFFLGRVWRDLDQRERALAAFDAAIEQAPDLFWAHYERLVMRHRGGADAEALTPLVELLAALNWDPLAGPHVAALQPIAHALWDEGQIDPAGTLLERLWPSEELAPLALHRLAERASDPAIAAAAAERLKRDADAEGAEPATAEDAAATGDDPQAELRALEKRRRIAPRDFQTWLALARARARAGDREQVAAVVADHHGFTPRQRSFVQLIVDLELGDVNAAFLAFRTHARLWEEIPKFPGIRIAYLLSDRHETAWREEVLALLQGQYPGDQDVALVVVNAAMRDQRWDEASALFERDFADLENKPPAVRLTRIDVMAFSGRLEEAAALLEVERVEGVVQPQFLRSTLRILSELDRWDEAFEAGLHDLGADSSFEHFLSVMVRAARRTERSAELLDALVALPRPLKRQQVDAVHAVAEDLAELGEADVLHRIGDVPIPPDRLHRITLKLRSRAPVVAPTKDLCIYYCADQNYLTPALVSMTALAMSNVGVARRADFRLVVDSDVVRLARAGGEAIAARLGIDLEVVDAATVVGSADRLRTAYGLFTGGQTLALAAYYRIFYARHLVDTGRYAQAFYVDADTLVRGGLDELFEIEMAEPVWARPETDRPEVRHATAVHGLTNAYFNSGVLRFDLGHPALSEALDRAIAAAIDPAVNLIFQDQCALNIGFNGIAGVLPDRFNYFNPPSVSGDTISAAEAVVVHFLDRPKPWDSLYRKKAREWFEWYDLIETLRVGHHRPGG